MTIQLCVPVQEQKPAALKVRYGLYFFHFSLLEVWAAWWNGCLRSYVLYSVPPLWFSGTWMLYLFYLPDFVAQTLFPCAGVLLPFRCHRLHWAHLPAEVSWEHYWWSYTSWPQTSIKQTVCSVRTVEPQQPHDHTVPGYILLSRSNAYIEMQIKRLIVLLFFSR